MNIGYTHLIDEMGLQVAGKVKPAIVDRRVQQALNANPNGKYARVIGFLFEQFTGKELAANVKAAASVDLASFVKRVGGPRYLDRALGWAYLSETRSSFDIEGESLSEDKAQRFVQLLHQAHHAQDLTEHYLAELQSGVISNPCQ